MRPRLRRVLLVLLVLVGVVFGVVAANIGPLFAWNMRPRAPFVSETPPSAPDYADPDAWSALPEREDLADRAPEGASALPLAQAAADVFYVHPTTYVGSHWNAPVDDPTLNMVTDRVATGIQASALNGCCAIYAPRYRQTNGLPLVHPSPDGDLATDLAYHDVRTAFRAFLVRRGRDRPFLLAAHSQGTALAARLLAEEIVGTDLRAHLVVAYLIGGTVTRSGLATHGDVSPCVTPGSVGCVVAWNARRDFYELGPFELSVSDRVDRVCTNPLSGRSDGLPVAADQNLGAVFLETADHAPRPQFADAQCVDGTLVVRTLGDVPRDPVSRILDHTLGDGNLHPVEYQLYFMNLRADAARRLASFSAR